ncbi:Putative porin [Pedobacter westerhofensis]|uniref:Porin n=1 Tax=Pedobacter westerhofensis TaxID=425512 RepID=A0A521DCB2_9SPHI|nr:putative porin [Pedobacter westerhofensis]SMO69255.1 Putative porin [Pedobacter westerhofensis]
MYKTIVLFFFVCFIFGVQHVIAQDLKTTVNENKELDSLRNKLENGKDSVVFTSRFVRYTTLKLTKDSIQTLPLDTSLRGFQNFSPIVQPRRPTINTGNIGLAAQALFYEPSKRIGFDPGFHSLDWYAKGHDDIVYYQARTPFTNLYYAGQYSGDVEQIFHVLHSQNIKKNWNVGASYNRIGANGAYTRQRGDVLNGTLFNWYTSPSKRYTLFANAIWNTMKAYENGSITNDTIFNGSASIDRAAQGIRLSAARQIYRKNTFLIKQSYFVGRIDTLDQEITKKVLPTNKVTYSLRYDKDSYAFQKTAADDHTVLPAGENDLVFTNDSTSVQHIQNEFVYSFFLRGKSASLIKNELKIDAGIRHDYYNYAQVVGRSDKTNFYEHTKAFQNVTLLGSAGYRFSDRVDLNFDVQQLFQGEQAGDFLYEAKSNVLVSKNVGRIALGAYIQNQSPAEIYDSYYGNHYHWTNSFDRTKTVNFSFKYINDKLRLDAGAEYTRITGYLYFKQVNPDVDSTSITPMQENGSINLLKVTIGKKLTYGKFNLDSYIVYQKTSNQSVMPTPEFYTFNSFYVDQTIFKVLKTNIGVDVRYNTKYANYAYNPAVSQFYIGREVKFQTVPVVDFWIRASLRKANIFLKYEYANQGLGSQGYYTVYKYPMPDKIFKIGVNWNFYD